MHEKVYLQEFFSYHPGAKAFNPNETYTLVVIFRNPLQEYVGGQ